MASRLLLRRSASVVRDRDGGLLSILRSELQHELSSNPPRSVEVRISRVDWSARCFFPSLFADCEEELGAYLSFS